MVGYRKFSTLTKIPSEEEWCGPHSAVSCSQSTPLPAPAAAGLCGGDSGLPPPSVQQWSLTTCSLPVCFLGYFCGPSSHLSDVISQDLEAVPCSEQQSTQTTSLRAQQLWAISSSFFRIFAVCRLAGFNELFLLPHPSRV